MFRYAINIKRTLYFLHIVFSCAMNIVHIRVMDSEENILSGKITNELNEIYSRHNINIPLKKTFFSIGPMSCFDTLDNGINDVKTEPIGILIINFSATINGLGNKVEEAYSNRLWDAESLNYYMFPLKKP